MGQKPKRKLKAILEKSNKSIHKIAHKGIQKPIIKKPTKKSSHIQTHGATLTDKDSILLIGEGMMWIHTSLILR